MSPVDLERAFTSLRRLQTLSIPVLSLPLMARRVRSPVAKRFRVAPFLPALVHVWAHSKEKWYSKDNSSPKCPGFQIVTIHCLGYCQRGSWRNLVLGTRAPAMALSLGGSHRSRPSHLLQIFV